MELAMLNIGFLWDLSPHLSFLFLPFGMRMSILCPAIALWKHIACHRFITGEDFASGWIFPQVSPVYDLGDI